MASCYDFIVLLEGFATRCANPNLKSVEVRFWKVL